MNIVLIGYRGTGKSSIGKALAKRTGKKYFSADGRIVEKAGMPIPRIVEQYGWGHFRDIESSVAEEISQLDEAVVDTGGGIILREKNIGHLRKNGVLILLEAALEKIVERIEFDPNRPRLKEDISFLEEQKKVLEERNPIYRSVADYVVETTAEPIEACVEKIIGLLSSKPCSQGAMQ